MTGWCTKAMDWWWRAMLLAVGLLFAMPMPPVAAAASTAPPAESRMDWWREARLGMFIHWGLYSIPVGQWTDRNNHGEWIMTTARIPREQYEQFRDQFNPVKFDAGAWVRAAKNAGMKYLVFTAKHHDGFCMFDSKQTDYDVMATPFGRDVLKELADACQREGVRLCLYYSIMDWHHPDYLPRRSWDPRPAEDADFERYVQYMKQQLRELLTNYGPIGVLWFDGQWEETWTVERGRDLYEYVRSLQPDIIVNDRVGKAGGDLEIDPADSVGDFITCEQRIPEAGRPGVDWETCMTMNDHWGYCQADVNYKSSVDLVRTLVDVASKGGNFLLNVGPDAEGAFPPQSLERLDAIGRWIAVNGESIYGTKGSPFESLAWGRCTQKALPDGQTRLYLHVFQWPADYTLRLQGIVNNSVGVRLLDTSSNERMKRVHAEETIYIKTPGSPIDPIDTVVVLDVLGEPDVTPAPSLIADADIFVDSIEVIVQSQRDDAQAYYTTYDVDPQLSSTRVNGPIRLTDTATISVRLFRDGKPVSPITRRTFTKVKPRPAEKVGRIVPGLRFEYVEGDFQSLPDFASLTPIKSGEVDGFDLSPRARQERFAFRYRGYLRVPADGVYRFHIRSDDGSRLWIGDQLVVDNDGLHAAQERSGVIALGAGAHPITVEMFQRSGDVDLEVSISGPGLPRQPIPPGVLWREP